MIKSITKSKILSFTLPSAEADEVPFLMQNHETFQHGEQNFLFHI